MRRLICLIALSTLAVSPSKVLAADSGTINAPPTGGAGATGGGSPAVYAWVIDSTGGGITRPQGTTTCTRWTRATTADTTAHNRDLTGTYPNGVRWDLYTRTCDTTTQYAQVPRTTPTDILPILIERFTKELLPHPQPATAPNPNHTIVNLPTWYWTNPTTWHPITATAGTPALTITATATPTHLRFTPGDGTTPTTCNGPGQIWTPADGDTTHSNCEHTYHHASTTTPTGTYPATLTIEWDITWTATNGQTGTHNPLDTTTNLTITTRELQALITTNQP